MTPTQEQGQTQQTGQTHQGHQTGSGGQVSSSSGSGSGLNPNQTLMDMELTAYRTQQGQICLKFAGATAQNGPELTINEKTAHHIINALSNVLSPV